MKKPDKNWLEWMVFGASALIVAAALVYLLYLTFTHGDSPPQIEVEVGSAEPRADHFAVPITVVNRGDQTAEGVRVVVTLKGSDDHLEQGEVEFAFVPRRSERHGWVTFLSDPRQGKITTRIAGYETP